MNNYLKKQYNFCIKFSGVLCFFLLLPSLLNARKTRNKSSGLRTKSTRASVAKTNTRSNTSSSVKQTETSEKKDVSGITKYNCMDVYNKCMNQTCYVEGSGRCGCDTTSKFEEANNKCNYILEVCPSQTTDIQNSYKRIAKSDCASNTIVDVNKKSNSISNVVASLTECMKKRCKTRNGEFLGCFDEDNYKKKLQSCQNTYNHISDKEAVEDLFKQSILTYKEKYCGDIYGTLDDKGECHLKIGIGPSFKVIKKVKDFKIGDEVVCSESGFDTKLGESKVQKLKYWKDIVLFGFDVAKATNDVYTEVKDSYKENISKDPVAYEISDDGRRTEYYQGTGTFSKTMDGTDIALESIDSVMSLTQSEHFGGVIAAAFLMNSTDYKYKGYCYVIKGDTKKPLFEESDEFYYKLRWTESWNTQMYSNELRGDN